MKILQKIIATSILVALPVASHAETKRVQPNFNSIVDAIYKVEGGAKTKHPYGILSVKTKNPRQVCLNTVRNNYRRWLSSGGHGDYLDYLADVYCPMEADPVGNKNWKRNIHLLTRKTNL